MVDVPKLPSAVEGLAHASEMFKEVLSEAMETPILKGWVLDLVDSVTPSTVAWWNEHTIQSKAHLVARLAALQPHIDEIAGPALRALAARALHHLFGATIDPNMLASNPEDAGRQLAHAAITAIIGDATGDGVGGGHGITPESGQASAERFIATVFDLLLDAWFEGTVGFGWISKDIPGFGELKQSIARHMGFSRLVPRALRPLFDITMVEPWKQRLNSTFLPELLNESQATRALNRGSIDEDTYFDIMARHGWPRGLAAELRMQHTQQLSRSDLQALYDRRLLTAADVLQHLRAQGFSEGVAEGVLRLIQDDRVSSLHSALATIARDMFRDGEIDEAETRQLLDTIGYSAEEKDALLAVARVERSRPRHVSAATMEQAYKLELIDVDALAAYYERERYAPGDVELLVTLAVREKQAADERAADRKLGRPPHLTDADYAEFHRRGIIDSAALRAALLGLRLDPPAVDLLVAQAAQRRAEYVDAQRRRVQAAAGVRVTRGTIEEAFIRGLVPEAQLVAAYQEAGFPGPDVELLLVLRREERAEFIRRQAAGAATSHT
jgi:hypothetical protein